MTREEAIKRFEKQLTEAMVVLDSGFGTRPGQSDLLYRKRKEMAEIALQALREQEERENPKLLTMDELKKMNGEPVWVVELNYWAVVVVEQGGRWHNVPFVYTNIDGVSYGWDAERRNLHCYRHKPKENAE